MTIPTVLLVRATALATAICAAAMSSGAQAGCTLVDSVIALGRVAGNDQLLANQGQVTGGTLVQGFAPPVELRLSGCSTTLPTSVRGDFVTLSVAGASVTFAPWLISENGIRLPTPKDLTQTSHSFNNSPSLGILLVPVTLPPTLAAGQYAGAGLLTFTD